MTNQQARDFATKISGPMTPEQAREFSWMLELGKSKITLTRGETTVSGVVVSTFPWTKLHIEHLTSVFSLAGGLPWTVRGVE